MTPFNKHPTLYSEQLQLLKDRGLKIKSDAKVLYLLERLSYYRLSGYWHVLLTDDKEAHKFREGANFETAFRLYRFDRDLRLLVLRDIEKIEVAIRAKMTYILSHSYSSFWFRNNELFKKAKDLDETLRRLKNEYDKSDEQYIKAFKNRYSNNFPPSWMLLELTSFGSLSMLYNQLKPLPEKKEISDFFGLDAKTFSSWLHSLNYIRNVCAHHSRLWNRELQVPPRRLLSPHFTWLSDDTAPNNKVYYILSIMLYLLSSVNAKNQLIYRLKVLLKKYPDVDVAALGFPVNWEKEPLWKYKLNIKQRVRLLLTMPLD
jgi:abortive infection bacteriophage resistance protein